MDVFVSAQMDDGNRTVEGVGEPRSVPRVGEPLRTEGSQKMLRSDILFASRYPLYNKKMFPWKHKKEGLRFRNPSSRC
jgi:hypothetical protein